MRILAIGNTFCIRAFKQSIALGYAGHRVDVLARRLNHSDLAPMLGMVTFWGDLDTLAAKIRSMCANVEYDMVQVHAEPAIMGTIARKHVPSNVPVIYDMHDSDFGRGYGYPEDERECFECVDGFVFPSQGYRELLPDHRGVVIPSAVPLELIPAPPDCAIDRRGPVRYVYEGGIGIGNYRDYLPLAHQISREGNLFHLYGPCRDDHRAEYEANKGVSVGRLNYLNLLDTLRGYDWGYVGTPVPHAQWTRALPNKIFDYLAAGLPCIVQNCPEAAAIIEYTEAGVVVPDGQPLPTERPSREMRSAAVAASRKLRLLNVAESLQSILE